MTEIMPVPRNLNFTVLPAESYCAPFITARRPLFFIAVFLAKIIGKCRRMVYNIKDIVCYNGVVFLEAMELAVKSAEILDAKKAADIEILNISELTSIADYFVICTGNSTTQVKALADNVVETLKEEYGTEPLRLEGYKSCQWILIDYGSVVIHVFKNDMRDFYSLERLWGDAEKLPYK